ncbi:MAG TPA: cytochrome P460 family protein [Gemmata sp.]|nr:cytochrome P460 family protein [Gemmata sp.]
MRRSGWPLIVFLFVGCHPDRSPTGDSTLIEPSTFSAWPKAADKPIKVGPVQWLFCRAPTQKEEEAQKEIIKTHGPHMGFSIIVRTSPEAIAPFREGKPLPVGSVVVKEKYADALATGPLYAYAAMKKREAGYDPEGGDWEYTFVTLLPDRKVSRGRLTECASCHASAKARDFLFRSYPNDEQ